MSLKSIDSAILSILDVTEAGKVVTAEDWKVLWGTVFNKIESISTFCISVEELKEAWQTDSNDLKETAADIRGLYNTLAKSFIHYGDEAPTDPNVKLWVQESGDLSEYNVEHQATVYTGTDLTSLKQSVSTVEGAMPGDLYVNTTPTALYYCTSTDDAYSHWVRLYPPCASRVINIEIKADAWGNYNGISNAQAVQVNGITSNSKVDLNPTVDQLQTFHNKDVSFVAVNVSKTYTDHILIYYIGQQPVNTYIIQATVTEVAFDEQ